MKKTVYFFIHRFFCIFPSKSGHAKENTTARCKTSGGISEFAMKIIKLKFLFNSILLYIISKKLCKCKSKLNHYQELLPLTSAKLAKLSNNYQTLTKKWINAEKQILFLRGVIRLKSDHYF